jgi:Tfp pilus assembly major pilin PilA
MKRDLLKNILETQMRNLKQNNIDLSKIDEFIDKNYEEFASRYLALKHTTKFNKENILKELKSIIVDYEKDGKEHNQNNEEEKDTKNLQTTNSLGGKGMNILENYNLNYNFGNQYQQRISNLLNNIFQEYLKQEKDKSDLIVIYLDKSQDIFKLFKIEFYLENGECRYRIINNRNSIIIGSGSAICNGGSSEFILNIYNDAKKNGCDLTTAISAVIFNIKGKLEDLQSNVYCSTGISPVFHYAIIEGSTFELQELEIKGINLDKNKKINFFDYSIECNDDYDLIEFKDRINNNETKVEKIHKNVDYNTNKKFDPEKREE